MEKRRHSDRIQQALDDYNREHPDTPIVQHEEEKDPRNAIVQFWDKIGKTGQVIALVAGILTGLATIKPFVVDAFNFGKDFIYSVEMTRTNSEEIKKLQKVDEVNMSITKSSLHPHYHTNPNGGKVKLYQTDIKHGKVMTYHFIDSLRMPLVANENAESGYWYTIDDKGDYNEIK